MNQRINKVIDDIEKTKAKIAELQALLPELEKKRKSMENDEIVKLFRSANIKPDAVASLIESIQKQQQNVTQLPPQAVSPPNARRPADDHRPFTNKPIREDTDNED